jgi:RsmE family RNA methyltransferase
VDDVQVNSDSMTAATRFTVVAVTIVWMILLSWIWGLHLRLPLLSTRTWNVNGFSSTSRHGLVSTRARRCCFHGTSALLLNRFLFDPEEVLYLTYSSSASHNDSIRSTVCSATPIVVLPKEDYRTVHAATTLKLHNGDTIRAGVVGGCEGFPIGQFTDVATIEWIPEPPVKRAQVLENGKPPGPLQISLHNLTSCLTIETKDYQHGEDDKSSSSSSSARIPVSLILAVPRPLQLGRILPMISQLGVDHLVLTSAQKVPKDYFGSHLFRRPKVMRERLIEGLCQSGDVQLPTIHVIRNLTQFLDHDIDRLFPLESYARVIAHPQRNQQSKEVPPPLLRMRHVQFPHHPTTPTNGAMTLSKKIVIAVGPEGGWTEPEELNLFINQHGFQPITMGSRTLRTDCAVIGLLTLAHELCYEPKKSELR